MPIPNPTDISGCLLWLDATTGTFTDTALTTSTTSADDPVQGWADQSGNSNNVTEGTDYPTFQPNELNSLPIVRFDQNQLSGTMAGITGYHDFTMAALVKVSGGGLLLCSSDTGSPGNSSYLYAADSLANGGANSWAVGAWGYDLNSGLGDWNDDTWHVLSAVHDSTGQTVALYLDNELLGSAGSWIPNRANDDLFVGSQSDGGYQAIFDCAEIVVYDSALDSTQRGDLQDYFVGKWDFIEELPPEVIEPDLLENENELYDAALLPAVTLLACLDQTQVFEPRVQGVLNPDLLVNETTFYDPNIVKYADFPLFENEPEFFTSKFIGYGNLECIEETTFPDALMVAHAVASRIESEAETFEPVAVGYIQPDLFVNESTFFDAELISEGDTTIIPEFIPPYGTGYIFTPNFPGQPKLQAKAKPGVISATSQTYAPNFVERINTSIINSTMIYTSKALGKVKPGIISSTSQTYGPNIVKRISSSFIGNTSSVFTPKLSAKVKPGAITGTSVYVPNLVERINTNVINSTAVHAPKLSAKVKPNAISGTTVYAPNVQEQIDSPFISSTANVYTPKLSGRVKASPINSTAIFQPRIPGLEVDLDLLESGSGTYSPNVAARISILLVSNSNTLYSPKFRAALNRELLQSGSAYTPKIRGSASASRIESTASVYGPNMKKKIGAGRINGTVAFYGPRVQARLTGPSFALFC